MKNLPFFAYTELGDMEIWIGDFHSWNLKYGVKMTLDTMRMRPNKECLMVLIQPSSHQHIQAPI